MLWGERGGWELQDLAQKRSQNPAWGRGLQCGGHLLHPLLPPLLFFLLLCLNEAALSSACLPSGAERLRVQSHQRNGASAYELFVLPLLSVSWEANLLIVCIMTFGWQPQRGRNQYPDNNVIISRFNYKGCTGISDQDFKRCKRSRSAREGQIIMLILI